MSATEDKIIFPFIKLYRRNVAQTVYEEYAFGIIRTHPKDFVRKIELLPMGPNGWGYVLVVFAKSLVLVRFKDKKFQVVSINDKFIFNEKFVYAMNKNNEIFTTDQFGKLHTISCSLWDH